MATDDGNLDMLLRLLESKRNDAEQQREEQKKMTRDIEKDETIKAVTR